MRRKQRVVIGGDSSGWVRVQQGTVLGLLLFLIYINDIADQITSTVRLFADDCVLYRTVSKDPDADLLQKDLDRLCSWEKKWCMKFNADKCFVLRITNSKQPIHYNYSLNSTQQNSYSISHLLGTVTSQWLPLWQCSHCSLVPDTWLLNSDYIGHTRY